MTVFVILHYMALNETVLCIDSILNNVEGERKIVVVDNASPNGSIKGLREKYSDNSDVDVIETEKNLGFANGNNYGYEYTVKKYDPEFIVVMNNDMEITQSDFVYQIEKCYEEQSFFIMGPDIYSTKKQYHQNPQSRKLPTLKELKKRHRILWLKEKFKLLIRLKWWIKEKRPLSNKPSQHKDVFLNEVVINPMLHGSCYIFSKDFISRHREECFYNKTFMYLEAEILYYQALRDGETMVYCPTLHIDHHEDVATDAEYKKQYRKSIFSVQCLLQSTGAFIELMEKDEAENGICDS